MLHRKARRRNWFAVVAKWRAALVKIVFATGVRTACGLGWSWVLSATLVSPFEDIPFQRLSYDDDSRSQRLRPAKCGATGSFAE